MTVSELLNEVEARGITLVVDRGNLRCRGEESSLTPELIEELRERKTEIISLMKCGQCGTVLSGQINKFWRVLLDSGVTYLCRGECVFKAYPWKMEVRHDNGY
jgi:TubC N-terminal docking domain